MNKTYLVLLIVFGLFLSVFLHDSYAQIQTDGDVWRDPTVVTATTAQTLENKTLNDTVSVTDASADPADTGFIRVGNNVSMICAETSPASTDKCITLNAFEQFLIDAPIIVSGLIQAAGSNDIEATDDLVATDEVRAARIGLGNTSKGTCDSGANGDIYYEVVADVGTIYICRQTGASTYAWTALH